MIQKKTILRHLNLYKVLLTLLWFHALQYDPLPRRTIPSPFYWFYSSPIFPFKQNIHVSHATQFVVPNLVNVWGFTRICRLIKAWHPKLTKFYKEIYARGYIHWIRHDKLIYGAVVFVCVKDTKNCWYCMTSVKRSIS